jgi:glycosyltransferase involved in cell wall biosynthesis
MKKHLMFMHQSYPAQFGPISEFLLREHEVEITFFSQFIKKSILPGLHHIQYNAMKTGHEENPYFFARHFETECASAHGLYDTFKAQKVKDPDILVGHVAFGNMALFHVEYQDIPRVGFFELFYDPFNRLSDNRTEYLPPLPNRVRVPIRNALQLVELQYCTKGYSPTAFQRSTYPAEYQHKLSVLFDGIDVNLYKPGEVMSDSTLKRTWPADAKLVTYVSRGLEAMRGFDIFMEVAHRVSQKRADVHFVIAGNPKTHYGSEILSIKEPTFKEHVMKKFPYDLNRFHFLEWIPESALVDLFRLSDCHFYWTTPFTLSWSFLQALSTGVNMLASDTPPVRDALVHDRNGQLVSHTDIDHMVEAMLEILANPDQYQTHREQAREDMIQNFSFEVCLPKLADFLLTNDMPAMHHPPQTPVSAGQPQ